MVIFLILIHYSALHSFKPVANADFIIPVEIDDQVYQVYVLKRPRVDDFMKAVGEKFEVVIFTASLSKYADPVIDLLDKHRVCKHRLFREHCTSHKGNYVKGNFSSFSFAFFF